MNRIAVIAGVTFAFAGAAALAEPVTQSPGNSPQAQRWHQIEWERFQTHYNPEGSPSQRWKK